MLNSSKHKYKLKVISYNTSTASGESIVALTVYTYRPKPLYPPGHDPDAPGTIPPPSIVIPMSFDEDYLETCETFTFKYDWLDRKPDISQFKQYSDKLVTLTKSKPDKPSLYLTFDPRDYYMGTPKVDLYGKQGRYLGTSKEMSAFLINYFPTDTLLTLYIKE